jgi:hypothetical protein
MDRLSGGLIQNDSGLPQGPAGAFRGSVAVTAMLAAHPTTAQDHRFETDPVVTVRENFVACDVLSQLQRVIDNPRFLLTGECGPLSAGRRVRIYASRGVAQAYDLLGFAFLTLGKHESSTARLEQAVTAYRGALDVFCEGGSKQLHEIKSHKCAPQSRRVASRFSGQTHQSRLSRRTSSGPCPA